MPSIKYKCNNCEKTFSGDDFTSECPNCHDSNIVVLQVTGNVGFDSIIQFIKENKKIGYALAAILIFIFLYKSCQKDSNEKYSNCELKLTAFPGYLEFNLIKTTTNETTGKIKKDTLNFSSVEKYFNFRDKNGNLIIFDKDFKNRYYPCDSVVTIFWDNPTNYKLKDSLNLSTTETVPFINGVPDSKKSCFKNLDITSVTSIGNCSISIQTNLDGESENVILFSITGRGGPYRKNKEWDAHDIKKIDVWAYVEGRDTLKIPPSFYLGNGNPFIDNTCKPFDPTTLINTITFAGNAYGKNPTNKTLRNKFVELIDPLTKIYLDNKLLPDLSDLLVACQTQNENENRTFSVTVQVDKNNKKVSVYFK